jgi:hypothetical protein
MKPSEDLMHSAVGDIAVSLDRVASAIDNLGADNHGGSIISMLEAVSRSIADAGDAIRDGLLEVAKAIEGKS